MVQRVLHGGVANGRGVGLIRSGGAGAHKVGSGGRVGAGGADRVERADRPKDIVHGV